MNLLRRCIHFTLIVYSKGPFCEDLYLADHNVVDFFLRNESFVTVGENVSFFLRSYRKETSAIFFKMEAIHALSRFRLRKDSFDSTL